MRAKILFFMLLLTITACGGSQHTSELDNVDATIPPQQITPPSSEPNAITNVCEGYPEQQSSPYTLPWQTGLSFEVYTGNCRTPLITHSGPRKYAYDFLMPVGTLITAVRDGEVTRVVDHFSDDDHIFTHENLVFIRHADGSYALYIHLMQDSAFVALGDTVTQGQVIGVLGTSGAIGPTLTPHLHFEVADNLLPINSIPVTFSNTQPHPNGLIEGQSYTAEPF